MRERERDVGSFRNGQLHLKGKNVGWTPLLKPKSKDDPIIENKKISNLIFELKNQSLRYLSSTLT